MGFLKKVIAKSNNLSGFLPEGALIPIPRDADLEHGMSKAEMEAIMRKNPQMIQTADGYPFWKIDGEWFNGDWSQGDDKEVIESVLNDEMDYLIHYKLDDKQFEDLQQRVEDDVFDGKEPDWYRNELQKRKTK